MSGRSASNTYCQRLEKYSERGYAIAIPGFLPARVTQNILNATYAEYVSHDVLFRLGAKEHRVDTVQISHVEHSLLNNPSSASVTKERVSVAAKQPATVVQGVERLIVRHLMKTQRLEAPSIKFCEKHRRAYLEEAKAHTYCTLMSAGIPGEYVLLFGISALEKSDGEERDDGLLSDSDADGYYERTPLLRIYNLLHRHMDRLLDGYTGGALRQLLCRRVAMGSIRAAYEQVTAVLATRIKTNTRLQLVYDIIPEGATFDMGLSWVLDSRRSPLQADLSDEAYEEKYGVSPRLTFAKRERRVPLVKNWWKGIY